MGLNLKILLTLSLILLAFSVTFATVFTVIQQRELKRHLNQQGTMMVTLLSGSLQSGLFFSDQAGIEKAVQTFLSLNLHQNLKVVTVYDGKDGVTLRHLLSTHDSHPSPLPPVAAMAGALNAFHLMGNQAHIWEDGDLIIFTTPVSVVTDQKSSEALYFDTREEDGNQIQEHTVLGCTQLVIGKEEFKRAVRSIALQTALLTILFLLISLVATYKLTRITMAPLEQLIRTIQARRGVQAEEETDDVAFIGDTFAGLVKDLETSFSTIQDLKDGLEQTVTERTRELQQALNELQETHLHLAQSEKMVAIGRLVAGVAHEINNTTNFVSGALPPMRKRLSELGELLRNQNGKPPDQERCEIIFKKLAILLENISEGARRTNKIVGDLKTFARPADEQPGPTDINQCLHTTTALAYPEFKHRIELTLELAPDLPLVEAVSGQLNQVFMNLLLNAIQALPDHGAILIRTWTVEDQVHILFRDNGPGIPDGVIDRIFEPFFTTKEAWKGTGLGLSISYGIIRKHQGKILVRSEPGQGAEFEIILPLKRR
jgi:signal transduction histidine kinase